MKKTKKVYHYVEYSGNSIGCTDGGGLPIRTAAEQDSLDVEKLRHDSLKAIQNGKSEVHFYYNYYDFLNKGLGKPQGFLNEFMMEMCYQYSEYLIKDKTNFIVAVDNLSMCDDRNISKFYSFDNFVFYKVELTSQDGLANIFEKYINFKPYLESNSRLLIPHFYVPHCIPGIGFPPVPLE